MDSIKLLTLRMEIVTSSLLALIHESDPRSNNSIIGLDGIDKLDSPDELIASLRKLLDNPDSPNRHRTEPTVVHANFLYGHRGFVVWNDAVKFLLSLVNNGHVATPDLVACRKVKRLIRDCEYFALVLDAVLHGCWTYDPDSNHQMKINTDGSNNDMNGDTQSTTSQARSLETIGIAIEEKAAEISMNMPIRSKASSHGTHEPKSTDSVDSFIPSKNSSRLFPNEDIISLPMRPLRR